MTKVIETTVYTFDELSDKAKEKARDWWREASQYDEWWEYVYEDAAQAGLTLTGFDVYRADVSGNLRVSAIDSAKYILENHGEQCDTHALAKDLIAQAAALRMRFGEHYQTRVQYDDISEEFRKNLCTAYLTTLGNEYEYINSDEYVDECIEANEYTFTESGRRFG